MRKGSVQVQLVDEKAEGDERETVTDHSTRLPFSCCGAFRKGLRCGKAESF